MDNTILQGVRVLLLEDDALINLAMVEMLEEIGLRVSSFLHLHEALAAIERDLPDVAILDVNISGTLSYELAERLHENNVAIVFLSGYGPDHLHRKWRMFPHCHKPCQPAELKTLLVKALKSRKAG